VADRFGKMDGSRTGGESPSRPFDPLSFTPKRSRFHPANDNRQPLAARIKRLATIVIAVLAMAGLIWFDFR
jgi:hypothetical protein